MNLDADTAQYLVDQLQDESRAQSRGSSHRLDDLDIPEE